MIKDTQRIFDRAKYTIHLGRKEVGLVIEKRCGVAQGLVEYALILMLVVIVVIVILALIGPRIGTMFSNVVVSI